VRSSDIPAPAQETRLVRGMEIRLQRAVPVFLHADGQTRLVYTSAGDAGGLLAEQGVELSEDDRVVPGVAAALSHGTSIRVIRVDTRLLEEEVPIPFQTEQKKDSSLDRGRRKVVTDGKPGALLRVYEIVFADGDEEERRLLEERVVKEPVNKVVLVGTRETAPLLTASARDGRVSPVTEGLASWYGSKFHGRRTAYGDIFDMYQLTAAFPDRSMYGKTLRVTYLKSGRSVDVLVNDYGPHVSGRVIDLSMAAARAIGLMADGVGKVRVEIVR
jgi:hypothetical protein